MTRSLHLTLTLIVSLSFMQGVSAAPLIVKDGEPNAQIVISDTPERLVELAAKELQTYIEKISGAELPIGTEPSEHPVNIYVGESEHTESLGITDEGLQYGAYRMVSGPNRLVLLGHDFDFEPKEPYRPSRHHDPEVQAEWDRRSGSFYRNPMGRLYKDYNKEFDIWFHDEGGSLNAVYGFLRDLGVRWYMPGELGEVVPKQQSIALPEVDRTDRPDFAVRLFKWTSYGGANWDDLIWDRRLGLSTGVNAWGAAKARSHGMKYVIGRKEMQRLHPEFYALRGGERDIYKHETGTPCFSSRGLAKQAANYARAVFDIYDEPEVSIWPTDGFRHCGCRMCEAQDVSNLVFRFVDHAAREVYKTHPDYLVSSGAYTPYTAPPSAIEKFSPNVLIYIANRGRSMFHRPERWQRYKSEVLGWYEKVAPGHLMRGDNNRFSLKLGGTQGQGPVPFPTMHPRNYAKDMSFLKGKSIGERSEMPRGRNPYTWRAIGLDHLNLYAHGRTLWDADLDIEALLDEYYTRFYGPAAEEMRTAFEYAHDNMGQPTEVPPVDIRIRFQELLQKAREAAGDTVYGKRVQLVISELEPMDKLREEMKRKANQPNPRADAPLIVGHDTGGDEAPKSYQLKDFKTGEKPEIGTSFQVRWKGKTLIVDVRSEEPDMDGLYVTDQVWTGDSVSILIETQQHAYYQIEVNPEGTVFDADRKLRMRKGWSSMAEVETERGDDYWRVRVSIPVATDGAGDPNHYVVGQKPTEDEPWYINVGRTRVRGADGKQAYVFSPTDKGFHGLDDFARLEIR